MKYKRYSIALTRKEVLYLQWCIKAGAVSPFYHSLTARINAIKVRKHT